MSRPIMIPTVRHLVVKIPDGLLRGPIHVNVGRWLPLGRTRGTRFGGDGQGRL